MTNSLDKRQETRGDESKRSAFSRPRACCSAATSRHGGRRKLRYQDPQAYGGCCSRSMICGDNSSVQVDPDPMCLTSFGDDSTRPLALPRRDDVLVDKGTAVPKSCLSPMEMSTLTAAGGLLPAGIASLVTRTNFHQPPLWFCPTEKINLRTSFQYATTYSSFWKC